MSDLSPEQRKEKRRKLRQQQREADHNEVQKRIERLTCDISIEIFDFMKTDEEGTFKKRRIIDFGFSRNVQSDLEIDKNDIEGEMLVFPAVYGAYNRIKNDISKYRMETERRLNFVRALKHQEARRSLLSDPDVPNERITDAWVNAIVEEDEYVIAMYSLLTQLTAAYYDVVGFIAALDAKKDVLLELMRTQRKERELDFSGVVGARHAKIAAKTAKAGKS